MRIFRTASKVTSIALLFYLLFFSSFFSEYDGGDNSFDISICSRLSADFVIDFKLGELITVIVEINDLFSSFSAIYEIMILKNRIPQLISEVSQND